MRTFNQEMKGTLAQASMAHIAQLSFLEPTFHEYVYGEDSDRMMSTLCGAPAFSPMARPRNRLSLRLKHRKNKKQQLMQ
ncbi:MAG: hypothetical protein DHS20C10_12860 [marine bacterium B5-7]|nr:MAG: hypothetical protein DHS20C10_12860 [marine bacterium B5-7]